MFQIGFENNSDEDVVTSLKNRVEQRIQSPYRSFGESLVYAIYTIVREFGGYTLKDVFADDFKASQLFILIEMLGEELEKKQKAYEKANKGK